ncbi:MAG: flagellar basal body FlgE domain-containing protein [Myxococcales bacterium]
MNHRGRGWVVGAMGLQLAACGNALGGGGTQEQREPARPERTNDDAGEGASTTAAPTRSLSGAGMLRQRSGLKGAEPDLAPRQAGSEAIGSAGSEPAATPEDESMATPDAGWEAARCAGAPTRHLRMAGNLDAEAFLSPFAAPFSAENPWATSSFGSSFTGYDDQGRLQGGWILFVRVADGWDYHALMDGTALVIGEGHLSYDEQGLLTVEQSQELRLLTANGPGGAVELDLTGMTQLAAPNTITAQEVDGAEARWGTACASAEPLPPPSAVAAGPLCGAVATTRVSLSANLAADSAVANEPWDALAPSAGLSLPMQANDAQGTLLDFQLFLRKSSDDSWDYHVLVSGEVPGLEVASGSLGFNPNGSLRAVSTTRRLRLPNHDGTLGGPIELDFGVSTDAGGNGVDGVTSLPGDSFEVGQQRDGAVFDCLPHPPTAPPPASHVPSCAGERTTAVSMYFNLDPAAPLSDSVVAYSASTTVYDAALAPQPLELRFHHVEAGRWQCRVMAASAEIGVVDLHFSANGAPEAIENIPVLRLPLPDGSDGPAIHLGFDADWVFTSFSIESYGWLAPNGAPAHADGCVD